MIIWILTIFVQLFPAHNCQTLPTPTDIYFLVHLHVIRDGVLQQNDSVCTGVILTPFHILSSAFCTEGDYLEGPKTVIYFANETVDYKKTEAMELRWLKHNDFSIYPKKYDLALVELLENYLYNPDITSKAAIISSSDPNFGLDLHYKNCFTIGWGTLRMKPNGEISSYGKRTLNSTNLVGVRSDECLSKFPDYGTVICTKAENASPCSNLDMGSPLICQHYAMLVVFGYYVTGAACTGDSSGSIGAFRLVHKHRAWLDSWAIGIQFKMSEGNASAMARSAGASRSIYAFTTICLQLIIFIILR